MANGIRRFEAHNIEGDTEEEILVLVDGGEQEIQAFRKQDVTISEIQGLRCDLQHEIVSSGRPESRRISGSSRVNSGSGEILGTIHHPDEDGIPRAYLSLG